MAQARQVVRNAHIRAVVRDARLMARELHALDLEIEQWDGEHPPMSHLTERIETVEAGLTTVEAKLRAFRPSN